jgi:hypothetical protein
MIDSTVKVEEDIKTFSKLIDESMFAVSSGVTEEELKFDNKWNLLSLIESGYQYFPPVYQTSFLDPLKNLIETKVLKDILNAYNSDGRNILGDWVSCIEQRIQKSEQKETSALSDPTKAFTELCSDIYDGYVSKSVRKDANLPEYQIYAPITRWGGDSAFTHSVRAGTSLGIKTAIVSIPKAWSNNIALWSLSVHECYHDVVDAYEGLLNEVEDLIAEVFESPELKNGFTTETMNWNGEKCSDIPEFAAAYWRRTMSETLPDICSLLNIGPSAGISFALLALAKNRKQLVPSSNIDYPHPDSVLRIIIAREVTQHLRGLDIKVRNGYIEFFNKILEDYVYNKENLILYTKVEGGRKNHDYEVPLESMIKTVKILVEKVAFTRLKSHWELSHLFFLHHFYKLVPKFHSIWDYYHRVLLKI